MEGIVGYRFYPNDEELISYYLNLKIQGHNSQVRAINEVDVCKLEPWELPRYSAIESEDPFWYFFYRRDFKYNNSRRANRTTETGFWKVTGKDRKIKARANNKEIGIKKTLVFHRGRVPNGVRTNWVMHEYHPATPTQSPYVICRIKRKTDEKADSPTGDEGEQRQLSPIELQNLEEVPDLSPQLAADLEFFLHQFGPDNNFNSGQTSQVHLGPGLVSMNSPFTNAFGNGFEQVQFNTAEPEEDPMAMDFVNSVIIDHDSSDTDTENLFAQHYGQAMGSSSALHGNATSNEFRQMRMVHAPNANMSSSNRVQHVQEETKVYHDEILELDSSSGESVADTGYEINSLERVCKESPVLTRASRSQHQATSHTSVAQRVVPKTIKLQKNPSETIPRSKGKETVQPVTTVKLPSAEKSITEPKRTLKTSKEAGSKSKSEGSASGYKNSNSIVVKKPQLCPEPCAPSVYCLNLIVGVLLFVVFLRELLILH